MKKLFTLGYLSVFSGIILILLSVQIGIVRPGSNIAIEIIAALIFLYVPLFVIDIFCDDLFIMKLHRVAVSIRRVHYETFPNYLRHVGSIGTNLQSTTRGGVALGAAPSTRQASSAKGGDSEGEPPRLYTYLSFSQLVDCSVKTLRNKVSSGLFPRPIQTIFGPRFNQEHLSLALNQPPAEQKSIEKRKRGRPRIARAAGGKGGAA